MANRCQLYYITDRSQFHGDEPTRRRALLDKVAEAAQARVDYIQLRERDLSGRQLESLAREVIAVIREHDRETALENVSGYSSPTRLLINHRTDVALAAGADGVHLRSDDVGPHEVRQVLEASTQRLLTGHFLIAASCHSTADVIRTADEGADFAVFAAVFGKNAAPEIQPTGLAGLREASRAKIPVLALGGVTLENATLCLSAGAAGVAGIRLFQENKIEHVVRALRTF
jgi:thiamine-phosphate pyrophosphorylase